MPPNSQPYRSRYAGERRSAGSRSKRIALNIVFFCSCSTSLLLRIGRGGSDLSTLFRGVGEKQYLWNILQRENPWESSTNKRRRATWDRVAEKVMIPGTIGIPEKTGKRKVRVDVCRGAVSVGRRGLGVRLVSVLMVCFADISAHTKPSDVFSYIPFGASRRALRGENCRT